MSTLKSLEEFDRERIAMYESMSHARPNGIACPVCDQELYDSNPNVTLTTNPPKVEIRCKGCGYHGYRYA